MNKIKNLFLDLDGTLTDPKEGITKSIQYALVQMGLPEPSMDELEWCIGPSLRYAFERLLDSSDPNDLRQAIDFYRERYIPLCAIENQAYEGIHQTVSNLADAGYGIYLATAKPWTYATKILEHFELKSHFTAVHGSELDGTREAKADLLAYILDQHQLHSHETVMVGDREYDILGAKANQLRSVGVTYGYGSRDELERAGADHIVDHHGELVGLLS